ncbi:ABC transporter permease [Jiangella anatolica]|uniref:ABC transporter permease n=1 Tax=Jiangella anatolica TaxID=2670374 RepID=A0A2W2BWD4_9ACTN|nr:ABC transporter permease [Jiangella anatolica]PZF79937.1 ABC transporter permease [Jiangella anatolica]
MSGLSEELTTAVEPVAGPTPAARTWRAFRRNPLGLVAVGLLALLLVVALAAPLIADYPRGYGEDVLAGPSAAHWFGTDHLGRDIFAQVVWGTRTSMMVGLGASALAIVLGVAVGVGGAYFKRVDGVLGLLVDVMLSLPVLPLMILVAALAGPSVTTLVVVIAVFSWPEVARVVRSQALPIVGLSYVDAAHVMGAPNRWVLLRHVLPAVSPVIAVSVVVTASRAVLSEAGLAFLGLGDPSSWSWGTILYNAQRSGSLSSSWWTAFFPSLAILLLVVAATLVALAYNDARNPRTRQDGAR